MLRSISLSAALTCGLLLAGCDQAITDRYDGLEVIEVVEVVDTREAQEAREQDLFDAEQAALASTQVVRPVPRPAGMSLAGLSGSSVPEAEAEAILALPTDTPLDPLTPLATLNLPPLRPADQPSDAGLLLNISAVSQISDIGERPGDVAPTATDDAIRRAALAREAAEAEERLIAEAIAQDEAAQREREAQAEAERLAALTALTTDQEAAQTAARQAEQQAVTLALTQPEAQGQAGTPSSIFTPVVFTGVTEAVTAARQLNAQYARQGFDLSQVMAGQPVPNLIIQRMPEDMAALGEQDRGLMKEVFIKTVLPLCLRANTRIAAEREWYQSIPVEGRGGDLTQSHSRIVRSLALKYQAVSDADLLTRLAPIPPSLCLAQAIHDSNWGRNSEVQNQNGLFGSWGRSAADPAILLPMRGRTDTQGQETVFSSLERAVDAYALFLNRHDGLANFRARRAHEISIGQVFNGRAASLFLEQFRPQEDTYRERLLRLIEENELDQFDLTRLSGPPTAIAVN